MRVQHVPALQTLARWPVENVAAAVIGQDGAMTSYGDTAVVYELASVTKLLVAHAVLVAVEEGAVDLATPAGPPGATVAHLLAHASGLAFDTRRVEAGVAEQRIYSSAGFEILAEIVEDATGIAFGDYLREGVCEPLGMRSTDLVGPAGHGARSTVEDLSRFASELLAPRVISSELAAQARTVAFAGLDGFVPGYGRHRPNDWGLGYEIRGHKRPHWTAAGHSPATFGHFGQAGTFLWVDPERRVAATVLTDRPFGAWAKPLWSEFNDAVLADLDGAAG
ncbi:serine hydrolase domain-containing protein [Gordonia shandongensis]|uniref:serine hydrolase domain-containing protein n=1 Tax=Gordonia shandongensis TaxID=376351 RepID=UPI000685535B|nr:serine hydrolase domain-containing protein [Gordonia shandongensis]